MGRGRKRKSAAYRYFDIDDSQNESTCLFEGCGKKFKGHHGTNLLSHLKVSHHSQYLIAKQINDEASTSDRMESQTAQVIDVCVKLVTEHGRPFALIDDEAFQKLLQIAIGPEQAATISSRSIRDRISFEADKVRNEIKGEIKNKLICLKVDAATCHDRAFLGINAQYILNNSIVLRTLAVVQLDTRHTSDFLKDKIITVLHKYQINLENLYSITTDNGANMIKMVKLLNEHATEAQKEVEESQDHEDLADNLGAFSLANEETSVGPISISAVRCAAHTLQLAIHDAINSDNECKKILSDVRSCVRNLRRPSVVPFLAKKPILDCPTRWDSTYNMIQNLMELKDHILPETSNTVGSYFTSDEWTLIYNIEKSLKPSKILSKKIQEEQLTFGDFWYHWTKCQLLTKNISTFSEKIVNAMEIRQQKLFESDSFLSAIFLDPTYNSILTSSQMDMAISHLRSTWQKLQRFQDTPLYSASEAFTNYSVNNSTSDVDNVIETMLRLAEERKNNNLDYLVHEYSINIEQILRDFIRFPRVKSTTGVLEFWKSIKSTQPQLYCLAITALASPATQVSVERMFSSLKYVLSCLRCRLNDDVIEDILIIRNSKV